VTNQNYTIREATHNEFSSISTLMVSVYSQLEGFPGPKESPKYYSKLRNLDDFTKNSKVKLLVAITKEGNIGGCVVYFGDMSYYGSGGTAPQIKNAAGFRLLAVDPKTRGYGLGKLLTQACIDLAKTQNQEQIVIHSTKAMQIAWGMYEKFGFKRSEDLDFKKGNLTIYGFRLKL
jgi:GNAT superfamily N-acetyltransferase